MLNYEIKILSAPGKRKDLNRQELAEDIAGFSYYNNFAIFWLVDGAPGPEINGLEIKQDDYFGSRILAKYIGEGFANASKKIILVNTPDEEDGDKIFSVMKEILNEKLKDKINNLLYYFEERAKNSTLPIDHSESCYILEWSASSIVAIVNLVSRRGLFLTAGDCIGVIENNKKHTLLDKRGRIFVKWSAPISNIKDFKINITEKHNIIKIENIWKVYFMSDGVASIKDITLMSEDRNIDAVKDIAKKTDDDKTLIVFSMLESDDKTSPF